jgi:16S rRNA (uracil1498-N3)-methyltransferase
VAVLPGDGRLLRCTLEGKAARVHDLAWPDTEPVRKVRLAVALSKPDALEAAVRMATEVGVSSFVVFPSARSVVRWQPGVEQEKLERLRRIVREAAEVAFRTVLPPVAWAARLEDVLCPEWWALSESEDAARTWPAIGAAPTLLLGPEGGWAPQEAALLAGRSLSLGPCVMRVATAAAVGSATMVNFPGP